MKPILMAVALATLAAAQTQPKSAAPWEHPRTLWGDPDLNNVWQQELKFPDGRRIVGLDLADLVEIPYQPWSKQQYEFNNTNKGQSLDPEAHCLPAGVPRATGVPYPIRFIQTPSLIVMLLEGNVHSYRMIFMDGNPHPRDLNPTWMGHSTGKWEGNTLVVDTVGFNGKTWLDPGGHVSTEQLHVIERFTRTEPNLLEYEFTIDDPGAYTRTWGWSYPLYGHPDWEIIEYVCNENNKDVEHMIEGNP
jgi:hypothetical protein